MSTPWSPLDEALRSFRGGDASATVLMRTDVGGSEEVSVAMFLRSPADMGAVEKEALRRAAGRVLDVGAGAGAHAVPLGRAGLRVTALEILPEAREALRRGGIDDVRADVGALRPDERFDTILILMNGLGLSGALDGLGPFLSRLAGALAEGGQILADSTDPRAWEDAGDGRYPGEVHMQLGFGGRWADPFPFLFVDADTLRSRAAAVGLEVAVVAAEDDGRFLARLTRGTPRPGL